MFPVRNAFPAWPFTEAIDHSCVVRVDIDGYVQDGTICTPPKSAPRIRSSIDIRESVMDASRGSGLGVHRHALAPFGRLAGRTKCTAADPRAKWVQGGTDLIPWCSRWLVVLVLLTVIGPATGEERPRFGTRDEARPLFELCPPDERMSLLALVSPKHTKHGRFLTQQVQDTVEGRLRGAEVYDPNADPGLMVVIQTSEDPSSLFRISVTYWRFLSSPSLDWSSRAVTWFDFSAGWGDSNFILGKLPQVIDRFLAEYLRVRDSEACSSLRHWVRSNAAS